MGKHRAGRAAGLLPRIGTAHKAFDSVERRGRLFDISSEVASVSVVQAMEILELIAERRTRHVGVPLGLVDRIQLLS